MGMASFDFHVDLRTSTYVTASSTAATARPGERLVILLTYAPPKATALDCQVLCHIKQGPTYSLRLTGAAA